MATARGYDARPCQNRQPVIFHSHPGQIFWGEVESETIDFTFRVILILGQGYYRHMDNKDWIMQISHQSRTIQSN